MNGGFLSESKRPMLLYTGVKSAWTMRGGFSQKAKSQCLYVPWNILAACICTTTEELKAKVQVFLNDMPKTGLGCIGCIDSGKKAIVTCTKKPNGVYAPKRPYN